MKLRILVLGIVLCALPVVGVSASIQPEQRAEPPKPDISKHDFETRPLDYPYIAAGLLKYQGKKIAWLLHFDASKHRLSVIIDIDVNPDDLAEAIPRGSGFARSVLYNRMGDISIQTVLYPVQTTCTMDEINRVACDFKCLTETVRSSLEELGIFEKVAVSRMTPLP